MGPYFVNVGVQRCPPGCGVGPVYQLNWFKLCQCTYTVPAPAVPPEGGDGGGIEETSARRGRRSTS